jgi:hypothetical protein
MRGRRPHEEYRRERVLGVLDELYRGLDARLENRGSWTPDCEVTRSAAATAYAEMRPRVAGNWQVYCDDLGQPRRQELQGHLWNRARSRTKDEWRDLQRRRERPGPAEERIRAEPEPITLDEELESESEAKLSRLPLDEAFVAAVARSELLTGLDQDLPQTGSVRQGFRALVGLEFLDRTRAEVSSWMGTSEGAMRVSVHRFRQHVNQ